MQSKTRQHTLRIQEAFLALPDELLLAKVLAWAEALAPDGNDWEALTDYYEVMGYRVQSATTKISYDNLDALFEAEPEPEDWTTVPPSPPTIRQAIRDLPAGDIYHRLIPLLGDILASSRLTHVWGEPPNAWGDRSGGYDFMEYLAIYLRALAGQPHPRNPTDGKLLSQQDFWALRDFLASNDGYDLSIDEDMDDPWEDAPPASVTPPVCICGGTFRLAERWLVAAGGDVPLNLATLRTLDVGCDCLVARFCGDWPGPELRKPQDDWNPFERARKRKKPQKRAKQRQ